MFHVFYTRQAYVRTFMKDNLDLPDLRSHRSRPFANELHLTEPTNPSLHVSSYCTRVHDCVSNRPLRLFSLYRTRNLWNSEIIILQDVYTRKEPRREEGTAVRKVSKTFNYKFCHRENVGQGEKQIRTGKALSHAGRIYDFYKSCSSSSLGSTASLISEIVLSKLRRLVLGLVIVVPRLAVLLWPRLVDGGPIAGNVEPGVGIVGPPLLEAMARSRAAETPFAGTGGDVSSDGDGGFDIIARPS
jgi:hypothetical protein